MAGKLDDYAEWPWPAEDSRWLEEWAASHKRHVREYAEAAAKSLEDTSGFFADVPLRILIREVEYQFGRPRRDSDLWIGMGKMLYWNWDMIQLALDIADEGLERGDYNCWAEIPKRVAPLRRPDEFDEFDDEDDEDEDD